LDELSGIFVWALEGLKRLRERGHFYIPRTVETEINEYRKENNSVIQFVQEHCCLEKGARCPKDFLYSSYYSSCRSGGAYPLSKYNFGKYLKKAYPQIEEARDARERYWLHLKYPSEEASNADALFS